MADSKTQKLVEAAKNRIKAERELEEGNVGNRPTTGEAGKGAPDNGTAERRKEAAEEQAALKVQPRANTIDGNIDVEARGDVKGDGGDAKDYPDDDPDKALGTPVYEHGLHETTASGERFAATKGTLFGGNISPQTRREMERGKRALSGVKASRKSETRRASSTRTAVTDADTDPDGSKGAKQAERKAAENKK